MLTESPNRQYATIEEAHAFFNERLFDGKLPTPIITLRNAPRTLGWFHAANFQHRVSGQAVDEICLCANFFSFRDDKAILSTLLHEMVHQWQEHHGTPPRKCYHDREWSAKMEEVGLMPSDTGEPGGKRIGQKITHYVIAGGPFEQVCAQLFAEKKLKLEWQECLTDKEETEKKKPTRYKWVCPQCEQACWAKETANLMCGDCELSLEREGKQR